MSLQNIIDTDQLRERFKAIIRRDPDTGRKLSKDIGISTPTLMKFLQSEGVTNIKSLCLIMKWIERKEQEFKESNG